MANSSSDVFYTRLPVNEIPLRDLLTEEHLFYRVPETWHVIITDIKKSTLAVEQGKAETVNLLATGSIVAVLNIAYKAHLTVPFFFGGDGATFIIPESILTVTLQALRIHGVEHQHRVIERRLENPPAHVPADTRVGPRPLRVRRQIYLGQRARGRSGATERNIRLPSRSHANSHGRLAQRRVEREGNGRQRQRRLRQIDDGDLRLPV